MKPGLLRNWTAFKGFLFLLLSPPGPLKIPRCPEMQKLRLKAIVDKEAARDDEIVARAAAFCLRSLTMCTAVVHLLSGTPSGDDERSLQRDDAASHQRRQDPSSRFHRQVFHSAKVEHLHAR